MLLCALREWDRRLDFICAKKGKAGGAAVEKPKVPVVVTQKGKADDAVIEKSLRREDVERYLEQVLNKCKSRSLLLHSIEIGSTETGMWAVRIRPR
jgi:hypothetical protein